MTLDDSFNRSGFAQLYLRTAQIRHNDLTEFFEQVGKDHHGNLSATQLRDACDAAMEIHDYLQRMAAHLAEANARVVENYP